MRIRQREDLLMNGIEWPHENSREDILKLLDGLQKFMDEMQNSVTLNDSFTIDAAEYARAAFETWYHDRETTGVLEELDIGIEAAKSDEFKSEYIDIISTDPEITPKKIIEHVVVSHALKHMLSEPV